MSRKSQQPDLSRAAVPPTRQWDAGGLLTWLICGYWLVTLIAAMFLKWGPALPAGNELSAVRSIFTAANALTLTGFQGTISIDTFLLPGRILILLLTLLGAVVPMALGGMAVVRIAGLRYSDRQILLGSVVCCGVFTLLGAIVTVDFGHGDRAVLNALMLSASAFGNSGLHFRPLPGMFSWQAHVVLIPLAVLGGIGLPVLMELFDVIRLRGRLSAYSKLVLSMTAGLYLVSFVLLFLARWVNLEATPQGPRMMDFVGSTSTLALNSRTAGFPFQFMQDYPRMVQWLLIPLMIIGGSPAGTAGGIKNTTVVELARGVRRALRGEAPGHAFGLAVVLLNIYVALGMLFFIVMLWTDAELPADRLFFETISALSNVGLSFDTVMVVGPGLGVLAAAMLAGRIAPLAVLLWMARRSSDNELPVG